MASTPGTRSLVVDGLQLAARYQRAGSYALEGVHSRFAIMERLRVLWDQQSLPFGVFFCLSEPSVFPIPRTMALDAIHQIAAAAPLVTHPRGNPVHALLSGPVSPHLIVY